MTVWLENSPRGRLDRAYDTGRRPATRQPSTAVARNGLEELRRRFGAGVGLLSTPQPRPNGRQES